MTRDVSAVRADGQPVPKRRRTPAFSATGSDSGARCSGCGRGLGFIEGGAVISGQCNACAGVDMGEQDPDAASVRDGNRIRVEVG